jgi:alpha-amylase
MTKKPHSSAWRMPAVCLLALLASGPAIEASAPNPSRSVYVNLFEWTWTDVARECETFLGPKGFGGVQVSPPNEHAAIANGPWWQRYQPVSYQIVSRSGNRAQFQNMVSRCAAVGVSIYADSVINHMATGSGTGWAGSGFTSRNFPGTYGPQDFHWNAPASVACQASISNYQDRYNVQQCELAALPDLYTESTYVRGRLAAYLADLYSLGVRGYRIDAAKHMKATDLSAIISQFNSTRAAGTAPYIVQEVIDFGGEAISKNEYTGIGDVNEFGYGRNLANAFNSGNISTLQNVASGLLASNRASIFTDNHDTQRGSLGAALTYKNGANYTLANVFMLAWNYGYPQLMSSYAFSNNDQGPPTAAVYDSTTDTTANCGGVWVCEHHQRAIANMVAFRNTVGTAAMNNWWSNGSGQIAFGRGTAGYVILNQSGTLNRTFQTSLPAGTYCDVIAGDFSGGTCSGRTLTVSSTGTVTASVASGSAAAIHIGARVGTAATPTATPSTATPTPTAPPTGVAVQFSVASATTVTGQNVYVVGDIAALGAWNTSAAVLLSPTAYPTWTGTLTLPASTAVQYKYIKRDAAGTVVWESGANRTFTTPATGTTSRVDTWRP